LLSLHDFFNPKYVITIHTYNTNIIRIFSKGENDNHTTSAEEIPSEVKKLYDFEHFFNGLLNENRYIARSDYKNILSGFKELHKYFLAIRNGGILPEYCLKHSIDEEKLILALETLKRANEIVDKHNNEYII